MTDEEIDLTGRCMCGTVAFEISAPLLGAVYCHCKRCQRRSGALWSENGIVDGRGFRLVAGAEAVSCWQPPDGMSKSFCSRCGGHVFTGKPGGEGIVGVRLGAVDGDPGIRPQWHQFVESAPDWEPLPEDGLPRSQQRREI
jgi:hypothetical protein